MKIKQTHFGHGDNIAGNKIVVTGQYMQKTNPIWVKILLGLLGLASAGFSYAITYNKMEINQTHYGIGDNVVGDKIVNEIKPRFSETQSIIFALPSEGGKDTLNLDNIATLKRHVSFSENSIDMLLNVSPYEFKPSSTSTVTVEGAMVYRYDKTQLYVFDTQGNKSNQFDIRGRKFVVTLNKIKEINTKSGLNAREYVFGISEL